MKLVVADASPFVGLIKIGHVDILPKSFGRVLVPPEVLADLAKPTQVELVRRFGLSPPGWIESRVAVHVEPISDLDPGERAAISLALEVHADLLLIDETRGRQVAISLGIATARTAALMFDAANAGILPDLRSAYQKLRATNFRVPSQVLDELLARHERIKAGLPR